MLRKKAVAIFCAICLLIPYCSSAGAVSVTDKYLRKTDTFFADFDNRKLAASVGSISGSNIDVLEKGGDRSGAVLKVNATGSAANFTVKTEEPLKSEATLISFDIRADVTVTRGYMNILPSEGEARATQHRALYFMDSGNIGYFLNFMDDGTGTGTGRPYKANQWYHYDLWIDYLKGTVYHYIDGVEIATDQVTEDFPGVGGFTFTLESRNGGGVYLFDNIVISDFLERGGNVGMDGVAVPDSMIQPVSYDYDVAKNPLGYNFISKDVTFIATLFNVTNTKHGVKAQVEVTNEENQIVATETFEETLSPKEQKDKTLTFELDLYGFYYISTKVWESDTNQLLKDDKFQFQILNAPENGKKNPRMGFADHTVVSKHGIDEMQRKLDFLASIGTGIIRTDYQDTVATKGAEGDYEILDKFKEYKGILDQNGTRSLMILGREGGKYPPITEAEYKEWDVYLESMAKQFKGQGVIYEVWNEYNIPAFNYSNASPENYVKMLQHVYTVVKRVDPTALVLGFCVAPASKPNYEKSAQDWIREVLEAGGGKYMDMASVHLYTHNVPEDFSSERGRIIAETRAMLDEFGCEDIKIMCSEMGWSSPSDTDEANQANYIIRYAALTNDRLEYMTWYVNQCKQGSSQGENGYGFMRAWTKGFSEGYEPYAAKPVMLAYANWNTLMTGAITDQRIKMAEDTDYLYQFSLPDGKKALIIWNESGEEKTTALKLNAESVTAYDIYGNPTVISPYNGKFTVDYSGRPIYIIGEFDSCSVEKSEFESLRTKFVITSNDKGKLNLKKVEQENIEIRVQLPENLKEVERNGRTVTIASGDNPKENEKIRVSLFDKDTGAFYHGYTIPVAYEDAVTYSLKPSYFRNGRWHCVLELKNNTYTRTLSGTVKITEPLDIAASKNNFRFENLLPQNVKYIRINVPQKYTGTYTDMTLGIKLDNGDVLEDLKKSVYMTSIAKMSKPPTIDGVLETGEWNKDMPMVMNSAGQVKQISDWSGTDDLSGNVYCAYDKENFYIAAEVTDDIFCDIDDRDRAYAVDGLQFAFANLNKSGQKKTEYGIAIVNGKPKIDRYYYIGVDTGIVGMLDVKVYEGTELKVTRNGNKTVYEGKFPWEQIYGEKTDISKRSSVYFSVLINENDGFGRAGWIEYCGGIGGSKDPGQYIEVKLEK